VAAAAPWRWSRAAFFCREVDLEIGQTWLCTPPRLPVFLCFACIGTPSHLLCFVFYTHNLSAYCKQSAKLNSNAASGFTAPFFPLPRPRSLARLPFRVSASWGDVREIETEMPN
jgi:hypothetical protein